jgi:Uma2 family endonuclease
MATTTTMSGAAFDQLPYDKFHRWELLRGELIAVPTRTPGHQIIVGTLAASLYEYLGREQGGIAVWGCEYALGDDDRMTPDIGILLREKWASIDRKKTPIPVAPDIAVEVISPSERADDISRKVWTYLGAGVQEVWEISPATQRIFVYRGAKSITVLEIGESLSTPLLQGWEISIREIFEA